MPQPNDWTNIPLTVQLIYLMTKSTLHCREDEVIFVADNILDLVRLLVLVNKVCKIIPEGKISHGKPRNIWLYDIENNLKKMGFKHRRKIARDKDTWYLILLEARVGP